MYRIRTLLQLVLGLTAAAAPGASNPARLPRSVGNGVVVRQHEMPYVVFLEFRKPIFGGYRLVQCTGSLISRRHVLTAAHCVQNVINDPTITPTALLGEVDNRKAFEHGVRIKKMTIHPDAVSVAKEGHADNDVAVLTLEQPVELNRNVQLIALANTTFFEEHKSGRALTAGWGDYIVDDDVIRPQHPSEFLRKVWLELYNTSYCAESVQRIHGFSIEGFNATTNLCSGSPTKGVAGGDSGAPLVVFDNGAPRQIGILSWGHTLRGQAAINQEEFPAVFERVDRYLDWIQKVVDEDNAQETDKFTAGQVESETTSQSTEDWLKIEGN